MNSHFDAGATWTSTRGQRRRIDYIAVYEQCIENVSASVVVPNTILASGSFYDHDLLITDTILPASHGTAARVCDPKGLPYDVHAVKDHDKREKFKRLVGKFVPEPKVDIDSELARVNGHVLAAATSAFPVPRSKPMKSWISPYQGDGAHEAVSQGRGRDQV